MDTMHLMDADAKEEEALCKATVETLELTSVQDYMERRMNKLPMSPVCCGCKTAAVTFAKDLYLALAADTGDIRASADKLEKMAANSRTNAEIHRHRVEEAEMDAARFRRSAELRTLEADQLEHKANEQRQPVDSMAREVSLDFERG